MGEAKRRKQLDPNFGIDNIKIIKILDHDDSIIFKSIENDKKLDDLGILFLGLSSYTFQVSINGEIIEVLAQFFVNENKRYEIECTTMIEEHNGYLLSKNKDILLSRKLKEYVIKNNIPIRDKSDKVILFS